MWLKTEEVLAKLSSIGVPGLATGESSQAWATRVGPLYSGSRRDKSVISEIKSKDMLTSNEIEGSGFNGSKDNGITPRASRDVDFEELSSSEDEEKDFHFSMESSSSSNSNKRASPSDMGKPVKKGKMASIVSDMENRQQMFMQGFMTTMAKAMSESISSSISSALAPILVDHNASKISDNNISFKNSSSNNSVSSEAQVSRRMEAVSTSNSSPILGAVPVPATSITVDNRVSLDMDFLDAAECFNYVHPQAALDVKNGIWSPLNAFIDSPANYISASNARNQALLPKKEQPSAVGPLSSEVFTSFQSFACAFQTMRLIACEENPTRNLSYVTFFDDVALRVAATGKQMWPTALIYCEKRRKEILKEGIGDSPEAKSIRDNHMLRHKVVSSILSTWDSMYIHLAPNIENVCKEFHLDLDSVRIAMELRSSKYNNSRTSSSSSSGSSPTAGSGGGDYKLPPEVSDFCKQKDNGWCMRKLALPSGCPGEADKTCVFKHREYGDLPEELRKNYLNWKKKKWPGENNTGNSKKNSATPKPSELS
jgi:hypothetical protein